MKRTAAARALLAVSVILASSGCGVTLASVPLPSPGTHGEGFTLTAMFANALSLPSRAKVKLNGANVGEVESLTAKDYTAVARLRIRNDAPIYAGATAELRSATPLGDLFVAIKPDPHQPADARRLRGGDVIPLNRTSAAATVEDVLSSMAMLANGGAIRQTVRVLNGAGLAVGGKGEKLGALIHQSTALLSRLNARSAEIDDALRSTSALAATIDDRRDVIENVLDAAAPATDVVSSDVGRLIELTESVERITRQIDRFPSMQGKDDRSTIADLNHLAAAFQQIALDPNLSVNTLNRLLGMLTKTLNAPTAHANADFTRIALGWLPDKNYPGDPGTHFPDGTDYHAAIGSLRYEWNVLLGKIFGQKREN